MCLIKKDSVSKCGILKDEGDEEVIGEKINTYYNNSNNVKKF